MNTEQQWYTQINGLFYMNYKRWINNCNINGKKIS
jgi:hypothetical protein